MKLDVTRFMKEQIEETGEIELNATELKTVCGGFCPESNGFPYGDPYGYGESNGGFPYGNGNGSFPYGESNSCSGNGFPYGYGESNGFPYGYGNGCNR